MDEQTDLLRQIRDLLLLIAEPVLAKRDEQLRMALVELVGKSKGKAKAVLLMDGSRTNITIHKQSGIDQGNLSRLIKSLRMKKLIAADEKPRLVLSIPADYFEKEGK